MGAEKDAKKEADRAKRNVQKVEAEVTREGMLSIPNGMNTKTLVQVGITMAEESSGVLPNLLWCLGGPIDQRSLVLVLNLVPSKVYPFSWPVVSSTEICQPDLSWSAELQLCCKSVDGASAIVGIPNNCVNNVETIDQVVSKECVSSGLHEHADAGMNMPDSAFNLERAQFWELESCK